MDPKVSEIVQMILNSQDPNSGGILQQAMMEVVEKQNEHKMTDEEKLLLAKMRRLKKAEDDGKLIWMNYESWGNTPGTFQMALNECTDPLLWGGVFFELESFLENEPYIMGKIGLSNVAVIFKRDGNYQFFCIDIKASDFNAKKYKVKGPIVDFTDRLVKSYSVKNNKLVIEEYEHKR